MASKFVVAFVSAYLVQTISGQALCLNGGNSGGSFTGVSGGLTGVNSGFSGLGGGINTISAGGAGLAGGFTGLGSGINTIGTGSAGMAGSFTGLGSGINTIGTGGAGMSNSFTGLGSGFTAIGNSGTGLAGGFNGLGGGFTGGVVGSGAMVGSGLTGSTVGAGINSGLVGGAINGGVVGNNLGNNGQLNYGSYPSDFILGNGVDISYGGIFGVTSGSPISPNGLSVVSDNILEGPVAVSGQLPFLGAVSMGGAVPSGGFGGVSYGSGYSDVGILEQVGTGLCPCNLGIGSTYAY